MGNLASIDQDAGATHSYTLVSGAGSTDNDRFEIQDAKLQIKADTTWDFETQDSYSVRVRTTDNGGLAYEEPLTIQILDVNETPTALTTVQ